MPSCRKRSIGDSEAETEPGNAKRFRPDLHLLDMPIEIICQIMFYLSYSDQANLRLACKQLLDAHTSYMINYYKRVVHRSSQNHSVSGSAGSLQYVRHVVLEIIAHATGFFRSFGYEQTLAASLLSLLREAQTEMLYTETRCLTSFLINFLSNIEPVKEAQPLSETSRRNLEHRRLIYTMTLFRLLRQFRHFRVISDRKHLMHWKLTVEVGNIFISPLTQLQATCSEQRKRVYLMAILGELLAHDKLGHKMSTTLSSWIFGLETSPRKRGGGQLKLNFTILAPSSCLSLLEGALAGRVDLEEPIIPLVHLSPFTVRLDIASGRGPGWAGNWSQKVQIDILSLAEVV